jgi:hypothetical protein
LEVEAVREPPVSAGLSCRLRWRAKVNLRHELRPGKPFFQNAKLYITLHFVISDFAFCL